MPDLQITAARTPRLDLPFLFPGQAQKEAFVNEALVRLDALVQPSVISETDSPPAEPVDGDAYIVGSGAGEAWTGYDGHLAIRAQSQWLFFAPSDAASVFDRSSEKVVFYRAGAGWTRAEAPEPVTGGAVQDIEARAAIASLAAALRIARIIS